MPMFVLILLVLSLLQLPSWALADSVFIASQGGPQGGSVHQYSLSGQDLGAFGSDFESPTWVTADRHGNVYVSDYNLGGPIHKLSPAGVELLTIPTDFLPGGIAVGPDGSIYVAHYDGGKVSRFSAMGVNLGVFASLGGSGATDFITFDRAGYLYVGELERRICSSHLSDRRRPR